ncbi:uncharacterized protein LOC111702007, partial [Eurytemora carolleeae]|uniref:uncharacterized protein LOC111702007 n=1 Tax=Eurytemora carolleeae TaxID=1294199 RepID=UPI000C76D7A8
MAISLVSENCSDQETVKLENGKNGERMGENKVEKRWTQKYKAVYLERNRIGVCCILGLLGLLTMMNIGLTLWLITSLRLNVNGSGPISFLENGLQIRGSTFSLGNIVAKEISGGVQDLKILSDRNIVFEAESTLLNLKHNTEVDFQNADYRLCVVVNDNEKQGGCQQVTIKLKESKLDCSLGSINREDIKSAAMFGSYDYLSCSNTCCRNRVLGPLFSSVLGTSCPQLKPSCSSRSDVVVINSELELELNPGAKVGWSNYTPGAGAGVGWSNYTQGRNQDWSHRFLLDCVITDGVNSIRFQKQGKLELKENIQSLPKPQSEDHLSFYPKDYSEQKSKIILSLFVDDVNIDRFRFSVEGCAGFLNLGNGTQRTYYVDCSSKEYNNLNLSICDESPKVRRIILPLSLYVKKAELEVELEAQENVVCKLIVKDENMNYLFCPDQDEYNLIFHKLSPPLSDSPAPEPSAEPLSLVIDPSWRKYARVGNLRSTQSLIVPCKHTRETKKLDVLANILYINSNGDDENEDEDEDGDKDEDWLNILTNNTSICLKDKENGAKLTLSISVRENVYDCNRTEWCSAHGTQELCQDSCHSVTGEECIWLENGGGGVGEPYSTCAGNQYCADGVCDALELMDPGICAQDCAIFTDDIVLLGTGIQNMNGYGIIGSRSANNTCTCSHHNCQCAHNSYPHSPDPQPYTPEETLPTSSCGKVCEFFIYTSCLSTLFILTTAAVVNLFRRKNERSAKYIESVTSVPLSDYAEDSRSTTSTLATNTTGASSIFKTSSLFTIDKKYEFSRNQLIIEETLGEGEFGKVVSAKA